MLTQTANVVRRITGSPVVRNAVFLGTAYSVSEVTQQAFIGEGYDFGKVQRFGIWGLCFNGPFLFGWYKLLDGYLHGSTLRIVGTKMCLDQFLITPICIVGFYTAMSAMEGKSDIFAEAKQKSFPTFLASLAFWVPAQAINFKLVPPTFRVVYIGTVSFMWANILCYLKRQDISLESE
ncbi:mpv17-like protein [Glandiceps talaboti]